MGMRLGNRVQKGHFRTGKTNKTPKDPEPRTVTDESDTSIGFSDDGEKHSKGENGQFEQGHVKAILIGGSNCRDIQISGDDHILLDVEAITQGGLKITEASEKLEEVSSNTKPCLDAVIVHTGSCDFPINHPNEFEDMYTQYVELLNNITSNCPKAHILVSSTRAGTGKTNINDQIREFNKRLATLAVDEENVSFIDNDVHFTSDHGVNNTLYRATERAGLHINTEGKARLSASMCDALKEMYIKTKVEQQLGL